VTKRRRRIKFSFRKLGKRCYGIAWNEEQIRLIEIDPRLSCRDTLCTAVHEALHLADWDMSETKVLKVAGAITDVLWRMGYRKPDHDRTS
jgi:hypothetical protein